MKRVEKGTSDDDYSDRHHLVPRISDVRGDGSDFARFETKDGSLVPLEQDRFEDEGDNRHPPNDHIGSARTPWYRTTIILLSEVMGTGVLSLPYAARTLGWVWTMIAIPLFAWCAAYSGWLLAAVKKEHSSITSYADASKLLFSSRFGAFTEKCMLINWGALAVYYMIALSEGIGDLFGSLNCDHERSLVAVAILILPCQCRDFYNISKYLSIPSTLAVLVLLGIVIFSLLQDNNDTFGATTTVKPLPDSNFLDFLQALSAFVFAYQGQSIYLELMSEMKFARLFPKACNLAYIIMCMVYWLTVSIAYGVKGANTSEFLPDSVPEGLGRRIAGFLVVLHITVSYVIVCQPLHSWFHLKLFPRTYQKESKLGTVHWFLITVGYLIFGFVVGNLIPFFADVQAFIGSLFGAPTIFGWPPAFYIYLHRQQTNSWNEAAIQMGYGNAAVCVIFLFVCTPLFCVLGTSGAIQSIFEDSKDSVNKPFQCY